MSFSRRHLLYGLAAGSSAIATVALPLATSAQSQTQVGSPEPQTWKLMSVWDSGSPFYGYLETFIQQVKTLTQGQLELKLTSPQNPRTVLGQVSQGAAQMGHGMPLLWLSELPGAAYVMALPFGLTAAEQTLWLQQGGGQALADEVYATVNCKYFPGGNTGLVGGGWFTREIEGIPDLQGLKIQSSGLAAEVWKTLGVEVVTLNPEVMRQQLTTGELQGAEYVSPAKDLQAGLHQIAPYYYLPGWQRPGTLLDFFINFEDWNSLAPAVKVGLEAAIALFNDFVLTDQTIGNQRAFQQFSDPHSVQVRPFPESLLLRLESVTGELLAQRSAENEQVKAVVDSLLAFRSQQLAWTQQMELSYLSARRWNWV